MLLSELQSQETMAAVFDRTEIGLRQTGFTVSIPNHPKARLMYYLNCMCQVLAIDDEGGIETLTDYRNYYTLDEIETDLLVYLCAALSPDVLMGKCIFPHEELCGELNNQFFELSEVTTSLAATEHIIIGGQSRKVKKIMTFKMSWLEDNYIEPMVHFIHRLQNQGRGTNNNRSSIIHGGVVSPALTYPGTPQDSSGKCCCTIL